MHQLTSKITNLQLLHIFVSKHEKLILVNDLSLTVVSSLIEKKNLVTKSQTLSAMSKLAKPQSHLDPDNLMRRCFVFTISISIALPEEDDTVYEIQIPSIDAKILGTSAGRVVTRAGITVHRYSDTVSAPFVVALTALGHGESMVPNRTTQYHCVIDSCLQVSAHISIVFATTDLILSITC